MTGDCDWPQTYLAEVDRRLSAMPDAIDKARFVAGELDRMPGVMSQLSRRRRDALYEARQTSSAQQIADVLGVSRARVYKLLTEDV